jgi:uncharacterized protein (DUF1778 family)
MKNAKSNPGKMDARKEIRMHRDDEARIKAAAAATGVQETDFIRQAALLRAQEVEQKLALSILPEAAFAKFRAAVDAPGQLIPGLAAAATSSAGQLSDDG